MGELRELGTQGDTRITWDPENEVEVKEVRKTFKRLKDKGYLAYSVKEDGERKEVVHEFDPSAEKIILAPPMQGG